MVAAAVAESQSKSPLAAYYGWRGMGRIQPCRLLYRVVPAAVVPARDTLTL